MISTVPVRHRRTPRMSKGGVLPLMMLAAVLIAVLSLVLIGVCVLYLVESKLRSTAESYVLQAGVQLNKGDRIGETNLMVERSREVVYTARQTFNEIESGAPHVAPLALLLLEDARVGAKLVDEERRLLSGILGKELEVFLTNAVKADAQAEPVNMMFFQIKPKEDIVVEVGCVKDIPSNAMAPLALSALEKHDRDSGYFFEHTDYYRPDLNSRLPAPDEDLTFRFASLAPKIKDTIADARLITPDDFDGQVVMIAPGKLVRPTLKNLPSALRFVSRTGVYAPLNLHEDLAITTISTSAGSNTVE